MKKAILIVSYGVANRSVGEKSLGMLEKEIKECWQEWDVYQAFTGQRILKKCRAQRLDIPDESQALKKLVEQGYKKIVVLPTHLVYGSEYNRVVEATKRTLVDLKVGQPLLEGDILRKRLAETMIREIPLQGGETVLYVGHGTKLDDGTAYGRMEAELHKTGQVTALVGTLDTIDLTLTRIDTKKVTVVPLLLTAGKHMNQDICGEENSSLTSQLRKMGKQVYCVKRGLIEYESVRQIYLDQVEGLVQSFNL